MSDSKVRSYFILFNSDVRVVCGSAIFKAILMAIDDQKKEDQFTSYKEVVKTAKIRVEDKTYPLKSCYVNCDMPGKAAAPDG